MVFFYFCAEIFQLSFESLCSILIFIGDDFQDGVIGMLFRLVDCDSRGDKPVDDRIKVIGISQLTEVSSSFHAYKLTITGARDQAWSRGSHVCSSCRHGCDSVVVSLCLSA